MSKKHYVVWKGLKTGVFELWADAKKQIDGQKDAQYMGFPSKQEAEQAFESSYTKALMKRSLAKKAESGSSGASSGTSSTKPAKAKSSSKHSSYNPEKAADIQIYCDGACSPNPGKSGTGIAVYEKGTATKLHYGLYDANGTNNTAELLGILEAFKLAQGYLADHAHVQILSDSKYSIDCITKWAAGWKKKGWKRGKGEEIKNLALIQACFELYQNLSQQITISHVKGHANIEGNELADRMAVYARSHKESDFVVYQKSIDIASILAMPSG